MPPSIFIWVQHLLGSGHARRAITLAETCAARGMRVTLASGGPALPWPISAGIRFVQLPAIRAADASFRLVDVPTGASVGPDHWAARGRLLGQAFDDAEADVVITEMFPFGRNAFRSEVLGLLARAHQRRPACRIAASVRDVLVSRRDRAKLERMRDTALSWYDRILVHGDASLIPFEATFPFASELGPRLAHTGYMTDARFPAVTGTRDEILVSTGGGRVGLRLLEAAIAARPLTRFALSPWRLVAGAALPQTEFDHLRRQAGPGVLVDRHHDNLQPFLERALVSVSQAGYNSAVETLVAGAPMVLVPFSEAAEDEQSVRAARLAELGLAVVLAEVELTPPRLAQAIDAAAERAARPYEELDIGGAERSAAILAELAALRRAG